MTETRIPEPAPLTSESLSGSYRAVLLGSGVLGTVEILRHVELALGRRPHPVLRRRFLTPGGPKFMFWAAEGQFVEGEQSYRPSGTRYIDDGDPFDAHELAPAD